jgi:FMN phosphatase YigB (HAD superfamily)
LEQVFALHEIGTVPDDYAKALHRLRESHRLTVVSDIWSKSDLYFRELERAGIRELFDFISFSSEHGYIKPSPHPFEKAIEAAMVDRSKIVFVGDSFRRDIAGAKAVGLKAIWINADGTETNDGLAKPDLVVQDLRDLLA